MAVVESRRRLMLVLWGIVFVVALVPAAKQADHLTAGGYEVPGSGSHAVEQAAHRFPQLRPNAIGVLVDPPDGRRIAAADVTRSRAEIAPAIEKVPSLSLGAPSTTLLAPGETAAVIPLRGPQDENSAIDAAVELREHIAEEAGENRLYLVGQPAVWAGHDEVSKESLASAEVVGFPLTLLILVAVFGSLAAAMLPLALGFVSIVVCGALIYGLAELTPMSLFVSNVASLIGIAVGVDYSLFILARYRRELAAGRDQREALQITMRTSGRVVLFSGVAVETALAGLFLIDSLALRSIALGAMVVVAVAVVAALTLTPAVILTMGERLHRPSARIARVRSALSGLVRRRSTPDEFWARWSDRVTRRPWLSLAAALAVLLVLAAPALRMKTVTQALPELPASSDVRTGAEAAIERFGPAASGETYVLVTYPRRVDNATNRHIGAVVAADPAVTHVAPPAVSGDGRHALFSIVPRSPAETADTRRLAERLEGKLASVAARVPGVSIAVGGTAAHEAQFDEQITGSLWKVVLFVLLASAAVMFVLLRSVLLPLKAIVMNVLTVGAAFGVLVAVFQWGWFDGFLGFESPGAVSTLALPFVLAIMFGLSMDYEVFLLARVQEEYRRSGDTRSAVQHALRTSAGAISSAAVIMIVVFLAFVAVSLATIKMIGLGLAVAVLLDATIVRLVLVPAAVVLMGDANWWAPSWLKRRDRETPPMVAAGG
ncbi:MAG TPA: MMPL family transporter [Thermoleophilaceae bacterium]